MAEQVLVGVKTRSRRHVVLGVAVASFLLLLGLWFQVLDRPDLPVACGPDLTVQRVAPGSLGYQAGLREGDRVLSVAGEVVSDRADLQRALAGRQPGEGVPCTVQRGGGFLTLTVPLVRSSLPASLWLAWGAGLLYGAVGTWMALRHAGSQVTRPLWFLSIVVMLFFVTAGSDWALAQGIRTAAAGTIGGLVLHLVSRFPAERPWVRERAAWLYVPGALGALWGFFAIGRVPAGEVFDLSELLPASRALWGWNLLCGFVGFFALVQGYRRVRAPLLRRQVEWMLWSGGIALAGLVAYVGAALLQGPEELHSIIAILACSQVPLSLAASFGRKVWSLDVVMRRAAVYSVMVFVLLSAWFIMLLMTGLLLGLGAARHLASILMLVGSILALAALLEPTRRAVERGVDRLLFRQRERWRKALGEASLALRSLGRVGDVASLLVEQVPRQLGVQAACLMLFDPLEPGETSFFPLAGRNSPDGAACAGAAAWLREQPSLWKEPLVLREWQERGSGQRLAPWLEAGWEVCLPLVHRGDLVGLWLLGRLEGERFYGPAEAGLLSGVGEEAAAALANAMLYEELLDLTRQLETRVEERTRELTGLLGRVAHALATPATSITGFAELLAASATGLDAQVVDHLRAIERHGRQLLALGRDMRIVALLASGRVYPRLETVDAGKLAYEVVREFLPEAHAAGVRLEANLPAADALVRADQGYLYRVLRVLVQNAIYYTPAGGSVQVRVQLLREAPEPLRTAGPAVEVAVADTGIGIPEDEREHIFDAFFRGQSEQVRARPGNGLGLTVAKGLVEVQGGILTCESQVGKGSTFCVVLPQAQSLEGSA